MDVVILCGGKGTRLTEETENKPKPLVEIGGYPILWHIMKIYSHYGFKRFILGLGCKGSYIKNYFHNYRLTSGDFSLKMDPLHEPEYFNPSDEKDWEIVFVDTGEETLKGGRVKRIEKYVKTENFHLTYGDGVCDIDLGELVSFHDTHNRMGSITAVHPPSRFGELNIKGDTVLDFEEKPQMHPGYINGGFFVFNKKVFSCLTKGEDCDLEFGLLQEMSREGELKAYKHDGFWQCMDNVRERDYLTEIVVSRKAPWVKW